MCYLACPIPDMLTPKKCLSWSQIKLKKYNHMLFLLLFTSGCKSNYVSYLYIDNLTEMSTAYCESNKLSGCDK
ncbi:Uncharacterised protein [Serratia fonticola]|uniref:Uncharacterized protein n=1 Tax=Serratia fonticola TaxID=47917 RepID=A0A4U9VD67_SERFO|nr:Uncharacterised protein [Serratia fonticola]